MAVVTWAAWVAWVAWAEWVTDPVRSNTDKTYAAAPSKEGAAFFEGWGVHSARRELKYERGSAPLFGLRSLSAHPPKPNGILSENEAVLVVVSDGPRRRSPIYE